MNAPDPSPSPDPTLAVAERQLAMLGELAQIAMAAARAYGDSTLATAKAEKEIVSEPWFTPEIGRARACGAKEASESLQKAARAVRLTLVLEMNLAEIVRDLRAGKLTYIGGIAHRKEAGEAPGSEAGAGSGAPADGSRALSRSAGVPAGSFDTRDSDPPSRDRNTERLFEFDRPDRLFQPALRDTVEPIGPDVGDEAEPGPFPFLPPLHREGRPKAGVGESQQTDPVDVIPTSPPGRRSSSSSLPEARPWALIHPHERKGAVSSP